MLTFARPEVVHLGTAWLKGANVFAAHAEQNQFRDVAEVEPDPSPIAAAVFA